MGLNQTSSEIEISCYDGTLSNDQFRVAAFAFAERWNKFNSQLPQCSWIPSPNPLRLSSNSPVDGYLSVENVILAEENFRQGDDCNRNVDLGCSNNDESIDSAVLVQNQSCEIHYYDFHIVYSTSYKVPVLYFRAHLSVSSLLEPPMVYVASLWNQ